jgi:hypothetical protein
MLLREGHTAGKTAGSQPEVGFSSSLWTAEAEHDAEPRQTAMEALLLVAERGGPTIFARIGIMRALNRHHKPVAAPRRKRAKACRVIT